ncbi:MAG TPA: CDP-alcohol phosphatidyltransferase family protein [Spirochaetota bacterium]|nr:CDP-alcohol phosphatidyltransferase family protein [Spirochaetota bacterium]
MGALDKFKGFKDAVLRPIIVLLKFLRVTPDIITWTGFLINIAAAYFIVKGRFITAGAVIIAAGLFDMLDGMLARELNIKSKFGGFLDSAVDRLSEGALYLGIIIHYTYISPYPKAVIAAYCVMFLSFLVSYLRARAGGLKIDCETGIFTRTERIIVLIIALMADVLFYAMILIGVLSFITVVQRFLHVKKKTEQKQ